MRYNCPICNHKAVDQFEMNYIVPDGWTLPKKYTWKLCSCGFIWADNDGSQEDYNEFYRKHYLPHIDKHDIHRLQQLASFIFTTVKPDAKVIDFGGGECYLTAMLEEYGFKGVGVCNVDDKMTKCDVIIASQVIEHIYNLDETMTLFRDNLNDNGIVIIELPEAMAYSFRREPPLLDYYPTHLNHFSPAQLDALFTKYGFANVLISGSEYKPTNAPMMRAVFLKDGYQQTFNRVREHIKKQEPLIMNEPVIVYGLGDLSLYQIARSGLDIKYYIDDAPIYKGVTINGIPVKDKIEDEYPIVVFGQRHKQKILEKLKGLNNKVVVL